MDEHIFRRQCKYCGKEFKAIYEQMANQQCEVHEMFCPVRKKLKGEVKVEEVAQ